MSNKPVTQAQLELLLSTIRDQSSEIEALRKRVADLESRVLALAVASASEPEDFEVVSTAKASSVPAASEAAASSLTISSSGISEARREIAREVGQWLKRCLLGAPRGPSGREKVSLQSRLYLVCRDRHLNVFFFTWTEAKPLCIERTGIPSDGIFIGLPSKEEARLALVEAGLEIPSALQR